MKRIIASALLIATTLSLAACSNTKSTASSTEKRDKTIQVSKKKTAPKKTSSSKKTSAKKVANKANNNSDQQPTDQNTNSQANNTQQAQNQTPAQSQQVADAKQPDQQSQAQNNQNTQQQAGGISYDENTLTGFVNKYGESPAAYKVEHEGMSTLQALQSTPDNMKTFGEKQTQQGMENGSLNPDGSASNQFGY